MRPIVNVKTENKASVLRAHFLQTLPALQNFEGVIGITINGGLSRGYADHLSEVDVTIYLEIETIKRWKQGAAPIANGITTIDGQLYDLKYVEWEAEMSRRWQEMEVWDLSYAEIHYDPEGKIKTLFEEKLKPVDYPDNVEGNLFSAWWHYQLAGDIWIHRGDYLQGHYMMNEAVISLIKALFALNLEYIPHEKWLIHLSRSLAWQPRDWEARLTQAMNTGNVSEEGLKNRQNIIHELWTEIDQEAVNRFAPDLPVKLMQKFFYDTFLLLAQKKVVKKEEWKASGLDFLNREPFHSVVTVEDEKIIFNEEKFLNISEEEMYSWHYEVLEAVRFLRRILR